MLRDLFGDSVLLWTGYWVIALLLVWPATEVVLRYMLGPDESRTGSDAVPLGIVAGLVLAALWPFVLLGLAAYRLSRALWRRVLGERAVHPHRESSTYADTP